MTKHFERAEQESGFYETKQVFFVWNVMFDFGILFTIGTRLLCQIAGRKRRSS